MPKINNVPLHYYFTISKENNYKISSTYFIPLRNLRGVTSNHIVNNIQHHNVNWELN